MWLTFSQALLVSEEPVQLVPPAEAKLTERVLDWLRRVLGLDRAIAFTVLARGWSSVAGLVTVALIARFLSASEQGYYYTFGSLVALQIVFELGFSFVVMQMATHERAHLSISHDQVITGSEAAHARLASVLQKSVRWYSVAAILMALALVPAGWQFFATHQHAGQPVSWRFPWCLAALAASLTFQIDPLLSFMEGCGYVAKIARLRLAQAATGSLMAWFALITHHGLFAPAMVMLGTAGTAIFWLSGKRRLLLGLLRHDPGPARIHWRKEVWPFQWRIAISWICGYFIFQLFNPVLFAFRGPIVAGQMGMSLSLAGALQSVAISWISTKSAPFGAMIACKKYFELDKSFFRAATQAVAVSLTGALLAWLGCLYMNMAHLRLAQRILAPLPLAMVLLSSTLTVISAAEATYLRAHKQEKFLVPSVIGAILVGPSIYFFGRYYGVVGMLAAYLSIGLFMGLPLGTYVFLKYRKLWHSV